MRWCRVSLKGDVIDQFFLISVLCLTMLVCLVEPVADRPGTENTWPVGHGLNEAT